MGAIRTLWDAIGSVWIPEAFKNWGEAISDAADSGTNGVGGLVFFGDDANTERPDVDGPVHWIGYDGTVPVNAVEDTGEGYFDLVTTVVAAEASASNPYQDLRASLGATLNLWEVDGTSWVDESANERDGTLHGSPTTTTGGLPTNVPVAVVGDGSNDYVTVDHHADYNPGLGPVTVECWVRHDSLPADGFDKVFAKGPDSGSTSSNIWGIYFRDDTSNVGARGGNLVIDTADEPTLTQGQWHHLVMVRDPDTQPRLRLYVDGVLAADDNGTATDLSDSNDLHILGAPNNATRRIDGAVAAPAYYPSVLSASDIADLYDAATGAS